MKPEVLIVGAGVAGLTVAARLADRGLGSLIVEQGLFPGGHASRLACKAADVCLKCNACLLEESLAELAGRSGLWLSGRTLVESCRPDGGRFLVRLLKGPLFLDPDSCVDCGLCLEACPAAGMAVRRSPVPLLGPRYGLDPGQCLFFKGEDCRACLEACPVGAIDLSATERREEIEVQAVVLAVGARPFDPRLKPRYGYGRLADVVSALELESMIRERGEVRMPSDGGRPIRVAFVQCVGSRDKKIGRDYCSRVCCGYALRMARFIRHRRPETEVTMFYMDIQTFGRNFDRFYRGVSGEVELIHGVPGEIAAGPEGELVVPFLNEAAGTREVRNFDLVVLSVGLGPPEDGLGEKFGLPRNDDGFLVSKPGQGLFTAGTATGPLDVAESRAQAEGTAAQVAEYLGRAKPARPAGDRQEP